MTDGDALLAAIRANPDEDTPRLAYADWLQEQGEDDRAEFIRAHIRLAVLQRSPLPLDAPCTCTGDDVSFQNYRRGIFCLACQRRYAEIGNVATRVEELLNAAGMIDADYSENHARWSQPLFGTCRPTFRRGLVEEISLPAPQWLAHGHRYLQFHPIRRVELTTWPGAAVGWAAEPDFHPDGTVRYGWWPGVVFELSPSAPQVAH